MYPHTLEHGNFHITPQLDSNYSQLTCYSPTNPSTNAALPVDKCTPHSCASTNAYPSVDKCHSTPPCVHKCTAQRGQMPFHTPLHPQMHSPAWTNAIPHPYASTNAHPSVDKCHSTPPCVHKCTPQRGQMPFHTPLHPQMHTPLRKDISPISNILALPLHGFA